MFHERTAARRSGHLALPGRARLATNRAVEGARLTNSGWFISGALFTSDYLIEAITGTAAHRALDVAGLRAQVDQIAANFPQNQRTNDEQTEDYFIRSVLAAVGWSEPLGQHSLTVARRDHLPAGLLIMDAAANAAANMQGDHSRRYEHEFAFAESDRWARPLTIGRFSAIGLGDRRVHNRFGVAVTKASR